MTPLLVGLGPVHMIVLGFWVADVQRVARGEIGQLKTAAEVPALLPGDVPALDVARRAADLACATVTPAALSAERERIAHLSVDMTLAKAFGMRERRALELARDSAQDRYRLDQDSGPGSTTCQSAHLQLHQALGSIAYPREPTRARPYP